METIRAPREAAEVMAKWWGDRVSNNTHHDNGDRGFTGIFAGLMADTLNEEVKPAAKDKFVELLTDAICNEENIYSFSHKLSCDYGPSIYLSKIAKEAGISCNNFPWKTCMQFVESDGKLKAIVKPGYQASWETIWEQ